MNNIFQQSIARTRAKIREICRLIAASKKQIKKENSNAETNLELMLGEIAAETGLEMTPTNLPTIMLYVSQFVSDQQRKKESDGTDPDGLQDFPI